MNDHLATELPATRVARSDLRVAPELASFLEDEALPGTGVAPETFWAGLLDARARVRPTQRRAAANGAPSCRRRSTHGTSSAAISRTTARPTRPSSPRSATCCPRAASSPSRPTNVDPEIATRRRAAARRADHQRPLRAQRGERPLGQPLRRPLRNRRDGQPAAGRRLRPRPRRAGRRAGAGLPRRGLPAGRHQPCRRAALPRARRRAPRRRPAADRSPRSSSAIAATPGRRTRCCCATTGCTWSSSSTAPT